MHPEPQLSFTHQLLQLPARSCKLAHPQEVDALRVQHPLLLSQVAGIKLLQRLVSHSLVTEATETTAAAAAAAAAAEAKVDVGTKGVSR